MKIRMLAVALLAGAWLAAPASAQAPALRDSLLEHMAGRWVLSGTIDGQRTTHDVEARWVLGHEYMRLTEIARERTPQGAAAYEAIVFIGTDPAGPGYACLWLDSTGPTGLRGDALGHAQPARGDSIHFVFKVGSSPPFHTTFLYDRTADQWQWHMDGETKEGGRQPFARARMVRAGTP